MTSCMSVGGALHGSSAGCMRYSLDIGAECTGERGAIAIIRSRVRQMVSCPFRVHTQSRMLYVADEKGCH